MTFSLEPVTETLICRGHFPVSGCRREIELHSRYQADISNPRPNSWEKRPRRQPHEVYPGNLRAANPNILASPGPKKYSRHFKKSQQFSGVTAKQHLQSLVSARLYRQLRVL
jgi:hypothetical protein